MKFMWVAALVIVATLAPIATPSAASAFEIETFSPLYEHVTTEITSRMATQVAPLRGPGFPTVVCLTTAPNCGRPTQVGCRPRPTLDKSCRATVNCNRTTAVTCGCPATTAPNCGRPTFNCPPPPPRTTAPNCGNPPPPPQPQPGPGPRTTAPNCR